MRALVALGVVLGLAALVFLAPDLGLEAGGVGLAAAGGVGLAVAGAAGAYN